VKIVVLNLDTRKDRLDFISEQLSEYEWARLLATNGHSLSLSNLRALGFKPYLRWQDPMLHRHATITEVATSITHYKAWMLCAELNHNLLILEDDSRLVGHIDSEEIDRLLETHDIVYLDHKEMFPGHVQNIDDKFIRPYYPYWNNAYAISPRLAKKLVNSKFKENIIPVDELFPLISGVNYLHTCLTDKPGILNNFTALVDIFKDLIPTNPIAYKTSIFNQVSRSVLGSDIESGESIMTQEAIVVTVATDPEKYKYLSKSSTAKEVPIINIGDGVEWKGGTMQGPGGGQKINLVKDYLKSIDGNKIVLFCDGHDVIINDSLETIVNRFLGFECDVLFAAEKICWPDRSMEQYFTESHTAYKYLNSGVYIGYKDSILSIIDDYIQDSDDDQLFLQKKYVENKSVNKVNIKLDYENYIFQCLSSIEDDLVLKPTKQFVNIATRCCPCILHGNGGPNDKIVFNNIFQQLYPDNIEFIDATELTVVAPDILEMDFLTPEMCKKIIDMAEAHGKWESMYGDKFPGQELRIREFSMELWNTLENHFKESINPVIEKYWFPLLMNGLRDAFIIKYSPETQKSLNCHHDASLVSGNVKLNDDYEGGDTYFYRQNFSNINTQIGKIILWPGQVTHGHEGREVTKGTKYNLVIWTSRKQGDINY
jgi:GR25 family glycosyltransferase involved in LPS biosynthesis